MPGISTDDDPSYRDIYRRTFRDVRNLRTVLPESSVISLAREVLLRIARHDDTEMTVPRPSDTDIQRLARDLISDSDDAGAAFVARVRAEGASFDTVYLAYLSAAARRLGTWWEDDRISLVDVTVGTGRIYAIMRALSPLFPLPCGVIEKTATFIAVPGETHSLGVRMSADLFRKENWNIDLLIGRTHEDLLERLQQDTPPIIGLSAAGEHALESLARLIAAIRIQDPAALVLIAGQVVAKAERAVGLMGADGMAADFSTAKSEMERLWNRSVSQQRLAATGPH